MFLRTTKKILMGWPLASEEEGGDDVAIEAEVMWVKPERYMTTG